MDTNHLEKGGFPETPPQPQCPHRPAVVECRPLSPAKSGVRVTRGLSAGGTGGQVGALEADRAWAPYSPVR